MARDSSYLDGFISRTAETDALWSIALGAAAGIAVAAVAVKAIWPALWIDGGSAKAHALYIWSQGSGFWWQWVQANGLAWRAVAVLIPAALAGLAAGVGLTWVMWPKRRRALVRHIRGPRLAEGHKAEKIGRRLAKAEGPAGVHLHPGFPLPLARETQHIIYTGTTGSGKTQGIMRLLSEIRTRDSDARMLIHDTKGDYVQSAPSYRTAVIGPTDSRGSAWHIAVDVQTELDAELIASVVISETKDPFWSSAARLVLTGMLLHCQKTHGKKWGWLQLAALLDLPVSDFQQALIAAHPVIGQRLDPGKTTDSIMMTIVASLSWIRHLAKAWPADTPGVSVTRWALGEGRARTIIFQHYDEASSLARPIIAAMVSLAARRLLSLPDSRDREVWLLLDELPALPRIGALPALLERGRSKGVRVVLAYQSYSQLIDVYGRETTQTIESLCGTSVFFRTPAGETAQHISEQIGETEDEMPTPTTQHTATEGRGSTSYAMQRRTEPLVRPEEVSGLPQPAAAGGVPGYLVVSGWTHVLRLTWPFVDVRKTHQAHKPADWVTGVDLTTTAAAGGGDQMPEQETDQVQAQEPEQEQVQEPVQEQDAYDPDLVDTDVDVPEDTAEAPAAEASTDAVMGHIAADAVAPVQLATDIADMVETVSPEPPPAPTEPVTEVVAPSPSPSRKSKKKRLAEVMLARIAEADVDGDRDR